MTYGLKKIIKDGGKQICIKTPKLGIIEDCSGYGKAKNTPFYMTVDGKTHRRFKTKSIALKYFNSYKRKRKKEINKMLE